MSTQTMCPSGRLILPTRVSIDSLPIPLLCTLLCIVFVFPVLSSAQCSYTGPFPASTYTFNLTFSNLSTASAPPLFATQLLASIDADLQSSLVPPPTASTIPDLQCASLTSQPISTLSTSLVAQLYILGTLTLDTSIPPTTALAQLLSDIHSSAFQQASSYPLDPAQHVPVALVCSDGSLVAVNDTSGCMDGDSGGGGSGLSSGVVCDIVILVLVVVSVVFGGVAWRWLQIKQRKDRAEGRLS